MRSPMEFYDRDENRFISGEFRPVRTLDSGAELGYFESFYGANKLVILVRYPDGAYFVAERLEGMLAQSGR
jgi:hypothetical protein